MPSPTLEMLLSTRKKEFELSRIEREVIKKHMFPLTPVPPPLCREGLMVCLVDKGCSLYETFKQNPYPMLRKKVFVLAASLSLWMIFRLTVDHAPITLI